MYKAEERRPHFQVVAIEEAIIRSLVSGRRVNLSRK